MVGLLQAPYGTRLYERMKSEHRLIGELSGDNTDDTMNFQPKMDPQMLHDGYRKILTTIYSPRPYYQRIRTFLRAYRKSTALHPVLGKEHIAAFFRSMYQLGVRGKERVEYWKLLFWTLLRRPRLFPDAVVLAIYGFHFMRVCELHLAHESE